MDYRKLWTLVFLLLLLPGIAWADPIVAAAYDPAFMLQALLAEVVPVIFELDLLRRLLGLTTWQALPAVLLANVASILAGVLVSMGLSLPLDVSTYIHSKLLIHADWHDFTVPTFFSWFDDPIAISQYLSMQLYFIAAMIFLALIVETPIYTALLARKTKRNVIVPALLVNAISYPALYITLCILSALRGIVFPVV